MSASSPIAKFYPTEFETDLNGRRNEWQAVALLPMIDLAAITAAYEANLPSISPNDLARNRCERALLFDASDPSPIDIPTGPTFSPIALSATPPPGVPTIFSKAAAFSEAIVPVQVFDVPSKVESILIKVTTEPIVSTPADGQSLLNQTVLYNWPYLRIGRVVAIGNSSSAIAVEGVQMPKFSADGIRRHLRDSRALEVSHGEVVFQLQPLVPTNLDRSKFEFSADVQLCLADLIEPANDHPILRVFAPPESSVPNIGGCVVFTRGVHAGARGLITAAHGDAAFDVALSTYSTPNIEKIIVEDNAAWIDDRALTRQFGVPFRALRAIMTSIQVVPDKLNIAFCLYSHDKSQVVSGCAHIAEQSVSFPRFVVNLLRDYFRLAGNLLKAVKAHCADKGEKRGRMCLKIDEIFPGTKEEQQARLSELVRWLSANATASKWPLVPAQAESLSVEAFKKIEDLWQIYKPLRTERKIAGVSPDIITWQTKYEPRGDDATPRPGARVAAIAGSGPAPFGARGTVVEVDGIEKIATVVFDDVLPCGTRLEGRLATNRGLSLYLRDLLLL
jgi:5'-3' exoribonuclease 1